MTTLQFKHVKRYKDLAWLLIKYGRSDIVKDIGVDIELPESDHPIRAGDPKPEELAEDLQKMGPTFVKLGQLLSTQTDVLPEEYLEALAKLQDRADPFPYPEVEKIFLSELGVKISTIFQEFDPRPLAAASLAQVHKAVLPSGRVVAVKVQRPYIQEQIIEDIEVLAEIAAFVERNMSWGRRYGLGQIVEQLRLTITNELDYKKEAINLVAFKRNLQEFNRIIVPEPVLDYSTSRILTMEFIEGQKITNLSPVVRMEIDGDRLAEDLFRAYLKQILIDGLVHVDPHPGNVYLSPDYHIVLLDLGMVIRIPPQMQNSLLKLLLAVSDGQGEEASDILIRLGQPLEGFDSHKFRDRTSNLIAQYQDLTLSQMAIGKLMLKIASIGGEASFILPNQFTMLAKALLNLDKVGRVLAPNFNPNDSIRQNAADLLDERMRRNFSWGVFYRSFLEATELLQQMPMKFNNILDVFAKNEMKIRVDAIDEKRLMIGFEKVANRITLGLILASLIVGAALLMRVETDFKIFGYPGLAMILFLAAALGGTWLALNILISDERKE